MRKTFQVENLIIQTPPHLMNMEQMQQFTQLHAQISALKDELHHLMKIDNDI